MASLTNPNPIDNTSPNRGSDLDANFDILKGNDDALNAELGTKANLTTVTSLSNTVDQRTTIQTGTGHAPAGTPVKMSWFEGTTDGSANFSITHGLGNNVLGFDIYAEITAGWCKIPAEMANGFYTNTTIFGAAASASASNFASKPFRCLVFHK